MKHIPLLALYVGAFICIMVIREDFAMTWHCNWVFGIGLFIGFIFTKGKGT